MLLEKNEKQIIKRICCNYKINKVLLEDIRINSILKSKAQTEPVTSSQISDTVFNSVLEIEKKGQQLINEIKTFEKCLQRFKGTIAEELITDMYINENSFHIACANINISEAYGYVLLNDVFAYGYFYYENLKGDL